MGVDAKRYPPRRGTSYWEGDPKARECPARGHAAFEYYMAGLSPPHSFSLSHGHQPLSDVHEW